MDLSDSLFPVGQVISQRIDTLCDLETYTWNLNRIQLTKENFYSHLDLIHTHHVQLGLTRRSVRIAVNGDIPENTISFIMILNDGSIVQQKHKMTNNHVAVLEHGGEIDAVFVNPIAFLSVAINRSLFIERYEQKFHTPYPVKHKFDLRLCPREVLRRVKETLLGILKNQAFFMMPEHVGMIEETIIDQMLHLLYVSTHDHVEAKWIETAYSLFEVIKLKYHHDVSIETLCKELNISQRNAYLTFQKHYKMTPKQYLVSLRLNNIKKALKSAHPKAANVQKIALQNGFYHMSHFAKTYKDFFGELPSQTLWKDKR